MKFQSLVPVIILTSFIVCDTIQYFARSIDYYSSKFVSEKSDFIILVLRDDAVFANSVNLT